MDEKIRPIYLQLTGILSQTPNFDNPHSSMHTEEIWNNYNKTIEKLNNVSGKNYSEFNIEPKIESWNGSYQKTVNGTFFRQQLNGLINYLHAEYFKDERAPFSGEPNTIFQQSQTQTQSTEIQVLMTSVLEVQEKLIQSEAKYAPDTSERKFINSLKSALKQVKNTFDLIKVILESASLSGIAVEGLKHILT